MLDGQQSGTDGNAIPTPSTQANGADMQTPLQDEQIFDSETGALPSEPAPDLLIAQLQVELDGERSRYADLYEKFQRASAEFQNSRRRQDKQVAEAIERASTHMAKRMLPVLDDLDLAFQNLPPGLGEDTAAWVDGFRQIQRKLLALLEEEGVTPMPLDGPFDPTRHEAITAEPSDSVASGHIVATLRTGYEQAGRVIRPALVRVAQ